MLVECDEILSKIVNSFSNEKKPRKADLSQQVSTPAMVDSLEQRKLLSAAGLTINPTFDATITSDPNAAKIESTINNVIAEYNAAFSNPITVNVTFKEMTTGLGQSNWSYYTIPYTKAYSELAANATTTNAITAVSNLPNTVNEPVLGHPSLIVTTADYKALNPTFNNSNTDGTISLNTSACNLDRTTVNPSKFDLAAVTAHELDEVLGLGSGLDSWNNFPNIRIEDLFRYDANGNRSYTQSTTAQAFFSINGTTDLEQFNQAVPTNDHGDWQNGSTPHVQDAYGNYAAVIDPNIEFTALNVIGYNYVPPVVAVAPTIVVTDAGGVYNGLAYPATASITDGAGNPVSGTTTFTYYTGNVASSSPPINVGTYSVVASFVSNNPNFTNVVSNPVIFNITAPVMVTHLVFLTQPAEYNYVGVPMASFKVAIEDSNNNIVTTANTPLSISGLPFSTPPTITTVNGVTTFTGAISTVSSLNGVNGHYTATITDGINSVTSTPFYMFAGPTTSMKVIQNLPATVVAGTYIPTISIGMYDKYGNLNVSDTSTLTLTVSNGVFFWTGTPNMVANPGRGIAVFANAGMKYTGVYSLSITDKESTLINNTLSLGTITVLPAATTQLVFVNTPTSVVNNTPTNIVVELKDRFGNIATADNSTVIPLYVNNVLVSSTTVINGVATFNVSFTILGNNTLRATTPLLSSSFSLTVI